MCMCVWGVWGWGLWVVCGCVCVCAKGNRERERKTGARKSQERGNANPGSCRTSWSGLNIRCQVAAKHFAAARNIRGTGAALWNIQQQSKYQLPNCSNYIRYDSYTELFYKVTEQIRVTRSCFLRHFSFRLSL